MEGIGHAGDLHELAYPGMAHFGLQDGHGAALHARAHLVHGAPLLAKSQRHTDGRADLGLTLDVLGLAGRLDKIRLPGRELVDQLDRLLRRELPVQVDHQLHVRPQRLAQCAHLVDDALLRHGRRVLEGVETAGAEFMGQLHPLRQRGARQARHIGRDAGHALATEQLDQRLAEQLAKQIPHRDVNAGDRIHVVAAKEATHTHQVVQVLLDHHGVARVAADDDRAQHVVDDAGDRVRRNDAVGLAPAHGAIVGRDLHQHRHVGGRVDGSVALADQVASLVNALSRPKRTQVRHVARDGDDEGLDATDQGKAGHGQLWL